MSYHKFKGWEGHEYGSFEVFHVAKGAPKSAGALEPGWYWWACFPDCLPDSDVPFGPFESEQAAIENANEDEF